MSFINESLKGKILVDKISKLLSGRKEIALNFLPSESIIMKHTNTSFSELSNNN
jgi:hypothetical protein